MQSFSVKGGQWGSPSTPLGINFSHKNYQKKISAFAEIFKGGQWGSNPRPSVPQTDILTN